MFHTAESGGCLLHFGTGDQTVPAEKGQQGRKNSTLHQVKKMCCDVTGGKCTQPPPHPSGDGAGPDFIWGQFWGKRSWGCLLTQAISWDLMGGDKVEWSLMIRVFNLVSPLQFVFSWGGGLLILTVSHCLISMVFLFVPRVLTMRFTH